MRYVKHSFKIREKEKDSAKCSVQRYIGGSSSKSKTKIYADDKIVYITERNIQIYY